MKTIFCILTLITLSGCASTSPDVFPAWPTAPEEYHMARARNATQSDTVHYRDNWRKHITENDTIRQFCVFVIRELQHQKNEWFVCEVNAYDNRFWFLFKDIMIQYWPQHPEENMLEYKQRYVPTMDWFWDQATPNLQALMAREREQERQKKLEKERKWMESLYNATFRK